MSRLSKNTQPGSLLTLKCSHLKIKEDVKEPSDIDAHNDTIGIDLPVCMSFSPTLIPTPSHD